MNTYVIGDIHGGAKALQQCLMRGNFDLNNDRLICLGDVCDGWPETKEAFDELLKIRHLIFILGNHDKMSLDWMLKGNKDSGWLMQGGRNTVASYGHWKSVPGEHKDLLLQAHLYYIDNDRLFVHAGILPGKKIETQDEDIFLWDRTLFREAIAQKLNGRESPLTSYEEVYIGHSPIHTYGWYEPVKSGDVWMMDTGAGWMGTLSMMNIDTKEVFVSDPVHTFYPPGSGRPG